MRFQLTPDHYQAIILQAIALGITLFGMMWGWRRMDRKEREEIREKAQAKQDSLHEENKKTFAELKAGQTTIEGKIETYGLHTHTERAGPLTVDGLWPPRD